MESSFGYLLLSLFFILSRELVVIAYLLNNGFRACFARGEGGSLFLRRIITVNLKYIVSINTKTK